MTTPNPLTVRNNQDPQINLSELGLSAEQAYKLGQLTAEIAAAAAREAEQRVWAKAGDIARGVAERLGKQADEKHDPGDRKHWRAMSAGASSVALKLVEVSDAAGLATPVTRPQAVSEPTEAPGMSALTDGKHGARHTRTCGCTDVSVGGHLVAYVAAQRGDVRAWRCQRCPGVWMRWAEIAGSCTDHVDSASMATAPCSPSDQAGGA